MKSNDQATRCPACKTVFRVVPDQLRVSDGWVRCGRCADVFNASEHMMEMDRAWTRLVDGTPADAPNNPENETLHEAAARVASPRAEGLADTGLGRTVSPDVWSAPRALSHRAKQDQDAPEDAPNGRRLASKIEAAMSRSQAPAPAIGPSASPSPPATADEDEAWGALSAAPWPASSVAPLDFEDPHAAYREDIQAQPAPEQPAARRPEPSQLRDSAYQADPFDDRFDDAIEDPYAATPPTAPLSASQASARAGADYAVTEPALFGAPNAEAAWAPQPPAAPAPFSSALPLDDFRADPRGHAEDDLQGDLHPGLRPQPRQRTAKPASAKPGFLRKAEREQQWRRPHMRALLLGGLVAGVLALTAQVAVAYRDLLAARVPSAKPLLQAVCAGLGCSVEAARAIDSLAVESSGLVRVDKTALYKLQVTLRNRSNLELALPALDVTFTDSKGELIARKVLLPQDLTSTIGSGSAAAAGPAAGSPSVLAAGREVSLQGVLQSSAAAPDAVAGYTVELFYP